MNNDTVDWHGPQMLEPEEEAEPGVAEISEGREAATMVGVADATEPACLCDTDEMPIIEMSIISLDDSIANETSPRPPLHVTFAHHGISPSLLGQLEDFAVNGGMVAVWHITNPETRDFRVDWHRHKQDGDYVDREVRVFASMVREALDAAAAKKDGKGK